MAAGRLTVPRICVKHSFCYKEFPVPVRLSPFHGRHSVTFRTIWNIFEAPATVIPYPVDLGICFQSRSSYRKFVGQNVIDFLGSTAKSIKFRTFFAMSYLRTSGEIFLEE